MKSLWFANGSRNGANWPDGFVLTPPVVTDTNWWSLRPLVRPAVPEVSPQVRTADGVVPAAAGTWNEIDAFVARKHEQSNLTFASRASRRTIIRRLYFDLIGLPPTVEQIERFIEDPSSSAYEKLVDRLLASPQYGERWARHWLDVVHYGDTHGYDKDKLRPNAWPYRDYVIRSFNDDKPWSRFLREQVAGDVLFPGTRDGVVALGFVAAGPWDFVGHAEVPESKIDGKIARHLDRDDMVRNTVQSFNSLTVGCAQCHNHKFDPITQESYYRLHAVFAALDRADKPFYADRDVHERSLMLKGVKQQLTNRIAEITTRIRSAAGQELADIEAQLEAAEKQLATDSSINGTPRFGYHSGIAPRQDTAKWVRVDLGESVVLQRIVLRPAYDSFNGIGAGFGFPLRFRIEASSDKDFQSQSTVVATYEDEDFNNPGIGEVIVRLDDLAVRYLRVTATKLAPRQNDFIFALAELQAIDASGQNRARDVTVTAMDSIEAAPRWGRANLVDGNWPDTRVQDNIAKWTREREGLWAKAASKADLGLLDQLNQDLAGTVTQLGKLPKPDLVYAATIHHGKGAFAGTGAGGGKPRAIHLLNRGDVKKPGARWRPARSPCSRNYQVDLNCRKTMRKGTGEWPWRIGWPLATITSHGAVSSIESGSITSGGGWSKPRMTLAHGGGSITSGIA